MPRIGVHVLFFLSGASGLVYQVVWVRQFGNLFGNTVHSAALVTAIFMLGLGLGGWGAGLWADRLHRRAPGSTLRWYAHFELAIGLCGLLIATLLPRLEPLSARFASYVRDAQGWSTLSPGSQLFAYALAVALLLPITTLMGGTLTLLLRFVVRSDLALAGWRIGLLYGVNTAGASLGAFLVDFALVPRLGLFATQSLAVLVNLGVGLVALAWARRVSELGTATLEGRGGAPGAHGLPRRVANATGVALFVTGFAAMGLEILWFRYLTAVLGSHRATFSLLLAVILAGMWIGAILGGAAHRRLRRPVLLFLLTQTALVVSTLVLLRTFEPAAYAVAELRSAYTSAPGALRSLVELWTQLRIILRVVGLPALLMGCAYPLANAAIQRAERSVAAHAGALYLANIVGAVLGALATGFLLLPALGVQGSLGALAICGLLALAPLGLAHDDAFAARAMRPALVACGTAGALALAWWVALPADRLAARTFHASVPNERVLSFSEGIHESIAIGEDPATGLRRLYTNGFSMSGTGYGGQRYMRAFAHLPLLSLEAPERVVVICFGVGNTAGAAALHPSLARIEVVDLSRHVLEQAPFFARWNRGVLADPRVAVFVNDGRQHLRMEPEGSYDLVTLEPPPIGHAGVSALYSREFYALAKSRLREGGYLSQWLPAYQLPGPYVASMVRAFLDVFPEAVLLSGYRNELILYGMKGGRATIDPAAVTARLSQREAVRADLEAVDLATPLELVGTYAGSPESLARAAANALPVTDDDPIMEYGPFAFRHTVILEELFEPESFARWCPSCAREASTVDPRQLDAYLRVLGALYRSPSFRTTSDLAPVPPAPLTIGLGDAEIARVVEASGYLRRIFRSPEADAGAGPDRAPR